MPSPRPSLPMLPGPAPPPAPSTSADRLLKELPADLKEPMFYLSRLQRCKLVGVPTLERYADDLPGWVPYRVVAARAGHGDDAIDAAVAHVGRPFVWAPELENVHDEWHYIERPLRVEGRVFNDSARYFDAQCKLGRDEREVMVEAVDAKLRVSPDIEALLLSTHDHPLLSLQADEVWGWSPRYFSGANLLGRIYAAYREEFRSRLAAGAASVWEPVSASARLEE